MQTQYVYVSGTCGTATPDGLTVDLREGDVWAADDPLVLARPGLFSETPPPPYFPRRTVAAVEQPPAEPTGRRGLRRA
jgi:hypothetical protein